MNEFINAKGNINNNAGKKNFYVYGATLWTIRKDENCFIRLNMLIHRFKTIYK